MISLRSFKVFQPNSDNASLDLGLLFLLFFLIFSGFSHEKLGLGDLGAGRRMRKRKNRRPGGFPNNKPKTALKLSWLRNALLLRSQT